MGKSYGSEHHMFRYRQEQPEILDAELRRAIGAQSAAIEWIYPTDFEAPGSEPEGLGFIAEAKNSWRDFLPARGSQQCWDGVARLIDGAAPTWLLIEAKANHPEFTGAPCGAKIGSDARKQIERALGKVKVLLGVHRDFSWMGSYYQYANRLAALYFLQQQRIPARLLFIYFVGETFPDGRPCPLNEKSWRELFQARDLTLGLPHSHALSDRIHSIFSERTLHRATGLRAA